MFTTMNVFMVLAKAALKTVENDKGVPCKVAECALVLEPMPFEQAQELGDEVASHLFTDSGQIRHELETITLDPRVPMQRMSARGVPEKSATEIAQVEVLGLTVARQMDDKTGREWLRATFKIRFDLAPRVHREWLVMNFGAGMYFSFALEQEDLPLRASDTHGRGDHAEA